GGEAAAAGRGDGRRGRGVWRMPAARCSRADRVLRAQARGDRAGADRARRRGAGRPDRADHAVAHPDRGSRCRSAHGHALCGRGRPGDSGVRCARGSPRRSHAGRDRRPRAPVRRCGRSGADAGGSRWRSADRVEPGRQCLCP
ncbi:hypothetical protein OY671_012906, partial [Metschnikowia pulcherrima]